jgi:hypothetical protein
LVFEVSFFIVILGVWDISVRKGEKGSKNTNIFSSAKTASCVVAGVSPV